MGALRELTMNSSLASPRSLLPLIFLVASVTGAPIVGTTTTVITTVNDTTAAASAAPSQPLPLPTLSPTKLPTVSPASAAPTFAPTNTPTFTPTLAPCRAGHPIDQNTTFNLALLAGTSYAEGGWVPSQGSLGLSFASGELSRLFVLSRGDPATPGFLLVAIGPSGDLSFTEQYAEDSTFAFSSNTMTIDCTTRMLTIHHDEVLGWQQFGNTVDIGIGEVEGLTDIFFDTLSPTSAPSLYPTSSIPTALPTTVPTMTPFPIEGSLGCGSVVVGNMSGIPTALGHSHDVTAGDVFYSVSISDTTPNIIFSTCGSKQSGQSTTVTLLRMQGSNRYDRVTGCTNCGDCGSSAVLGLTSFNTTHLRPHFNSQVFDIMSLDGVTEEAANLCNTGSRAQFEAGHPTTTIEAHDIHRNISAAECANEAEIASAYGWTIGVECLQGLNVTCDCFLYTSGFLKPGRLSMFGQVDSDQSNYVYCELDRNIGYQQVVSDPEAARICSTGSAGHFQTGQPALGRSSRWHLVANLTASQCRDHVSNLTAQGTPVYGWVVDTNVLTDLSSTGYCRYLIEPFLPNDLDHVDSEAQMYCEMDINIGAVDERLITPGDYILQVEMKHINASDQYMLEMMCDTISPSVPPTPATLAPTTRSPTAAPSTVAAGREVVALQLVLDGTLAGYSGDEYDILTSAVLSVIQTKYTELFPLDSTVVINLLTTNTELSAGSIVVDVTFLETSGMSRAALSLLSAAIVDPLNPTSIVANGMTYAVLSSSTSGDGGDEEASNPEAIAQNQMAGGSIALIVCAILFTIIGGVYIARRKLQELDEGLRVEKRGSRNDSLISHCESVNSSLSINAGSDFDSAFNHNHSASVREEWLAAIHGNRISTDSSANTPISKLAKTQQEGERKQRTSMASALSSLRTSFFLDNVGNSDVEITPRPQSTHYDHAQVVSLMPTSPARTEHELVSTVPSTDCTISSPNQARNIDSTAITPNPNTTQDAKSPAVMEEGGSPTQASSSSNICKGNNDSNIAAGNPTPVDGEVLSKTTNANIATKKSSNVLPDGALSSTTITTSPTTSPAVCIGEPSFAPPPPPSPPPPPPTLLPTASN